MIRDSDIDRIGSAIVDLQTALQRAGLTVTIRMYGRKQDEAALLQTGSRWVTRASKDNSIQVAGAFFSVGG